jgi:threonine dehydratase
VGIQVPKADREEFTQQLNALHYPFNEETANPAFRMFLGG